MGAGRKTKTYTLKEKSQPSSSVNCSISARNLRKSELGGVIFGCNHNTIKRCFYKQLFGLPAAHISYVRHIDPGLPLFLFNYGDRKLHGVFEAASEGRLNINPHEWTEDGSEYTLYPAQVRFRIRMQCLPLLEDQFGPVIADNYFKPRLFWFELDRKQTKKLISMFSCSTVSASTVLPTSTAKQGTLFKANCLSNSRRKGGGAERPTLDVDLANQEQDNIGGGSYGDGIGLSGQSRSLEYEVDYVAVQEHKITHLIHSSSVVKDHCFSLPQKKWSDLFENSTTSAEKLEVKETETPDSELNLPALDQFNSICAPSCIRPGLDGKGYSLDDLKDESGLFDEQFECLKQQMEVLYLSVATEDDPCSLQNAPCDGRYLETKPSEGNTSWSDRSEIENCCLSEADLLSDVKSSHLQFIGDKILQEVNKLKLNQFKQDQKISSLEKELVESRRYIKNLKQQLKTSESKSSVDESILIVGGFDGLSFLSTLDCYCPSRDSLVSLCPMSSVRSHTCAVKLNGEVFVIGGVQHNLCYDTVESYNLVNNQWITHPSLNQKRGNLAGISLNEKIFAIGGGNGVQCLSEVELFDIDVGRWIPTQSMLHKRYDTAAAEINGVVYVVGGYDGNDFLKSMERFDPREHSWTRVENMSTKRGCHSLAVLNEKLYAIGGYNGERVLSTVEVFDPRMGYWMMGESMNNSKGYSAAIVIGNSIFVIGGMAEDNVVLDTVECYEEAHGWQSTNLKAIGKRCYFSAVLL